MANPSLTRSKTGRRYVWPPKTDDPELLVPSVTTILNNMNKPALPAWAAREVATFAVENILSWENLPPKDAIDLLKRAPYRGMTNKGDIGTAVHEVVDVWLQKPDSEPPVVDDLDLLPYVGGAALYLSENVTRVIHSEVTIFNRAYKYAGTVDAIVKLKSGELAIVDWKTSKNVYPEHALQLVAYANGDFIGSDDGKETTLPPITQAHVVHLPGDSGYKAYPVRLTERAFKTFAALRTLQLWKDDYEADVFDPPIVGEPEEEDE